MAHLLLKQKSQNKLAEQEFRFKLTVAAEQTSMNEMTTYTSFFLVHAEFSHSQISLATDTLLNSSSSINNARYGHDLISYYMIELKKTSYVKR